MNNGEVRSRHFTGKLNVTSIYKLFILHFLAQKPCYGNELIDKISCSLNNKISPSTGITYPLLRDMEAKSLVKSDWLDKVKKSKNIYEITDEGIQHYKSIKLSYKDLLDESKGIIENTLKTIY